MKVKIIAISSMLIIIGGIISAWFFMPPWDWGDTVVYIFYTLTGLLLITLIWVHKYTLFQKSEDVGK